MNDPLAKYHEGFARLKAGFIAGLPQRMDRAEEAWRQLQASPSERLFLIDLHRELHNLIGACSTYGEDPLGVAARQAEQYLRPLVDEGLPVQNLDQTGFSTELQCLKAIVESRVREFDRENES